MRYFVSTLTDAGFVDPLFQKPFFSLQLLTISIVNEVGESITLIDNQFNPSQISEKSLDAFLNEAVVDLKDNVLDSKYKAANTIQDKVGISKSKMKKIINEFIGVGGYLYGYMPFKDFIMLEMLRGNSDGFYLHDIKQMDDMVSEAMGEDYWIGQDSNYPIPTWYSDDREHDRVPTTAEKAKWCKSLYEFIIEFKRRNGLK